MADSMKDLFKDWGLSAGVMGLAAWLWGQGLWSLLPMAGALLLACHLYLLDKRLPWLNTAYNDLDALNQGKAEQFSHLHAKLSKYAAPSTSTAFGLHNTERHIARWLGADIWTLAAFNRLLLFAVAYPMLFLLISWAWTDQGSLGGVEIFKSFGPDYGARMQRCLLAAALVASVCAPYFLVKFVRHRLSQSPRWGAYAESIAVVVASSGAGAGAVAVAPAPAGAGAGAGAGASAVGVGVGVAVAVAVAAFVIFATELLNKRAAISGARQALPLLGTWASYICLLLGASIVAPNLAASSPTATRLGQSFALLLFLGILPYVNAWFDWLSIGLTRWFLRQMHAHSVWSALWVVLDLVSALLLTLGLFALVFFILQSMQALGWPVDAAAIKQAFRDDPFDPQVSWVAMLALTNLLPSLMYMVLFVLHLLGRVRTRAPTETQRVLNVLLASLDADGRRNPAIAASKHAEVDLKAAYRHLYIEPWLVPLGVLAVVIAFWGQYVQALRWLLGFIL